MKDKSIEKIIEIAGDRHKYQYTILFLVFGIFITLDLLTISLPYLEKMPVVSYKEKNGNKIITMLNYEICETKNFTIVEMSRHSWVSEYGIYCDRVKTGLIGSLVFLGVLIGSIFFQFLSDKIGRRLTVLYSGYCFSFLLIVVSVFASNIYHIYVMSIFIAISAVCGLFSSFQLMNEVTGSYHRSTFGTIVGMAFSFCGISNISMLYYTDSWRICFIIGSLLNIQIITLFSFLSSESPRYYLNLKDIDLFFENLKEMSIRNDVYDRFNKMVYSIYKKQLNEKPNEDLINVENNNESMAQIKNDDDTVSLVSCTKENDEKEEEIKKIINKLIIIHLNEKMIKDSQNHGFMSLLIFKSLRYKFLIMCFIWFSISGTYYGLSINIKNLPGNIYSNGILLYLSEILAYIISGFLINIKGLGRRNTMAMFFIVSLSVFFIIIIFKLNDFYLTIFALIARLAISGAYNIIFIYTTEIYPTPVRSKGLGTNSVFGRIAGMIFPLLMEILNENIIYLFAFTNLLSIILVFNLPETLGKPLPNTISEEK